MDEIAGMLSHYTLLFFYAFGADSIINLIADFVKSRFDVFQCLNATQNFAKHCYKTLLIGYVWMFVLSSFALTIVGIFLQIIRIALQSLIKND